MPTKRRMGDPFKEGTPISSLQHTAADRVANNFHAMGMNDQMENSPRARADFMGSEYAYPLYSMQTPMQKIQQAVGISKDAKLKAAQDED